MLENEQFYQCSNIFPTDTPFFNAGSPHHCRGCDQAVTWAPPTAQVYRVKVTKSFTGNVIFHLSMTGQCEWK